MGLIDSALAGIGGAFAFAGEGLLMAGNYAWSAAGDSIMKYIVVDPTTGNSAIPGWSVVGNVYTLMQGIAASLVSLFFVAGWCRETIDIRQNFNLENNFKFFIRFILAVGLVKNGLDIIKELLGLGAALVVRVGAVSLTGMTEFTSGMFSSTMTSVTGGEALVMGFLYLIGGLVGMAVIFVCSIKIIAAVLGRFFRIFVIVPLAPTAFATFAGGGELSHTGVAWIKTFFGYLLEIVIVAIALQLCNKMFGSTTFFGSDIQSQMSGDLLGDLGGMAVIAAKSVLVVVECIMPVLLTTTCVTGAENTIRKCLGLNT